MRARWGAALFGLGALLVSVIPARAHEGHGAATPPDSWLHYLAEPMHLPAALLVLAAVIGAYRWFSGRRAGRQDGR